MADLAIITPTRGRPAQFRELLAAVERNSELDVWIYAGLDDDDPATPELVELADRERGFFALHGPRRSLSGWTNALAMLALQAPDPPRYLASLGDDHRPRTPGWDRVLVEAIENLGGSGIAYGNDLLQGAKLPTAWVVSADIVQSLGWMMLPECQHMYVDNATLALGRALERIAYCPGVIVEHLHPAAGKAPLDDSYRASNSVQRYSADAAAFEAWERDRLARDVERVRAALRGLDVVGGAR